MPKGEPTKVVRLPVWFLDYIAPDAAKRGVTVPELIVQVLSPKERVQVAGGSMQTPRCTCKEPTLSKVVTNLCTTCKALR